MHESTRRPVPGASSEAQTIDAGKSPTLLGMVAAVLREAGIDERSLQAAFASAMARDRSAAPDRHEALAASIIALWYNDPASWTSLRTFG